MVSKACADGAMRDIAIALREIPDTVRALEKMGFDGAATEVLRMQFSLVRAWVALRSMRTAAGE